MSARTPVLAHPDPSPMYVLTTDASTVGVGGTEYSRRSEASSLFQ